MAEQQPDDVTDRERLIFGAGFAFGALTIVLILGVLLATVVPNTVTLGTLLQPQVVLTLAIAIVASFVVGIGLYVLGIPEQGIGIPRTMPLDRESESDPDLEQ